MSAKNVVAHSAGCSPPPSGSRRINDTTLEAIRGIPLVDVVSAVVSLRRAGQRFIGLCPFHAEKSASFQVSPQKNLWFCHGCGLGGDVVRFVQLLERCSFRQAVENLAARAGLTVENSVVNHAKVAAEAERLRRQRKNLEVLYRQRLKAAIELDRLRQIERTCSLDTMPANLFSKLRRADVYYVFLNFLPEGEAIAFLRLSRMVQLKRIDEAIDDGFVDAGSAAWEVPLQ